MDRSPQPETRRIMAMRVCYGLVASAGWLVACAADPAPRPTQPPAPVAAAPSPAPPIAWAEARDCRAKLRLLEEAAQSGRLRADEQVPIAVVLPQSPDGRDWFAPPSVAVTADLPLAIHERSAAAELATPCILLVEPARDQRVGHRILDRELVRSLYQSGVRSERNPDYDRAQLRARQAEREAKDDGPRILKVGDPALDLVGMLIGGVFSGLGQSGREQELDAALAELTATPRSRDRPLYRPYAFERLTVVAGKEATVAVALLDRSNGRVWRAELRRRERREFALLEGLDPRDRDFDKHSAASLTRQDFERWQREPPRLELSAIAAALRDADAATVPGGLPVVASADPPGVAASGWQPEEVAAPGRDPLPSSGMAAPGLGDDPLAGRSADDGGRLSDDDGPPPQADAALALGPPDVRRSEPERRLRDDPRAAAVVHLAAGERSGSGVYVRHDLVLTTARLVGSTSVVDVVTLDGARVLGLVARVDPTRDLALVQVARPGPPVSFYDGPPLRPGQRVEAIALGGGAAILTPGRYRGAGAAAGVVDSAFADLAYVDAPGAPAAAQAMPWFVGDQVIGVVAGDAPDRPGGALVAVRSSEILEFLQGPGGALAELR